ncbi:MAG TPA: biotin--[acetyl-CoA-carboxylase] ligase [Streptosporangiaceae bacterium]|nr:biotin--[acetyl-CoA-carboxylase] ligase [Streptosporangiaceae bacterium]
MALTVAVPAARPAALDATALNRALVSPASLWREVRVVTETGSTNADLLAAARSGAPEGLVLVAEAQTAGRGRMGRRWVSPPCSALTFSVLLRPAGVPASRLGWVPLLAGAAVASALAGTTGVDARLKWPNDVLAGDAKLAGILAERRAETIVLGIGINVFQRSGELPLPAATSLLLAAPQATAGGAAGPAGPDVRERLLIAVLGELARRYRGWLDQPTPGDADGCGLRAEYLRRSATVGAVVTVTLPGGQRLTGTAAGVDAAGRLEVRTPAGLVPVSAGDVVHLRRADIPAAR